MARTCAQQLVRLSRQNAIIICRLTQMPPRFDRVLITQVGGAPMTTTVTRPTMTTTRVLPVGLAVPEPRICARLAAGVCALGLMARRRRRVAA